MKKMTEHYSKTSARKMHISWMMLRKQGALNNQMLRIGCCLPPSYQNSWIRACPALCSW